jgi:iron complex outermembrane receptor protein
LEGWRVVDLRLGRDCRRGQRDPAQGLRDTTARGSRGVSRYWDGHQTVAALTHGFGDLDTDRYNGIVMLEYKKQNEVWYRGRDWIGRIDLRRGDYSAAQSLGGTGAIPGNNQAGSAVNCNVRNPATNDYFNRGNLDPATGFTRFFPGAACSNFTNHPQGDPGGGCLIDSTLQYEQVLPKQESLNFYWRRTWQATLGIQAYSELLWYSSSTNASGEPSGVSTSVGFPGGPVSNAGVALGADHPTPPYFGTAARLRYQAADAGPRVSSFDSNFIRWVGGPRAPTSAGTGIRRCCSRTATSGTTAPASCSATWRSRC